MPTLKRETCHDRSAESPKALNACICCYPASTRLLRHQYAEELPQTQPWALQMAAQLPQLLRYRLLNSVTVEVDSQRLVTSRHVSVGVDYEAQTRSGQSQE